MAQIPFVNPEYFNPMAKVPEGISQGMSLANYLQQKRQFARKEKMQEELEAAGQEFEEIKKSLPAAPEQPRPITPISYGAVYDQMAGMSPTPVPSNNETATGLLNAQQEADYRTKLETVKSYPFEKKAEYLGRLKDIYNKYGEVEKANAIDHGFLETVKVLAGFSPRAAANVWNKSYPEMEINADDVKSLVKWKTTVFGPNRDGLIQTDDAGNIKIVQPASAKTEKPKTHLEYGTAPDGSRQLFELGAGDSLPDGWKTDKEIERERNKSKDAEAKKKREEDVAWREKQAQSVEGRHKETMGATQSRFEKRSAQREEHFQTNKALQKEKEEKKAETSYNDIGTTANGLPVREKKGTADREVKEGDKWVPWKQETHGIIQAKTGKPAKKTWMDKIKEGTPPPEPGPFQKVLNLFGGKTATATKAEPRKPGESIADYKKRVGQK